MASFFSRTRRFGFLAFFVLFTSPLHAQQVRRTAAVERLAPPPPPPPLGAVLVPPAAASDARLSVAVKERPVWMFPAIGAAAGALIGLAVGGGCGDKDCTVDIPPSLLGAVYGGVIGLVVEIAI
ncbi:hypothetical protein [Longimicrobium sp.]|uniref:hypothetical protein n=1 Tax=Longimicrobium sp. TaxID=2029185 RepID=UPI003B3B892E